MFWASPTATEIATPAVPAKEAAIEAAPVCTLIEELSSADKRIEAAFTPVPSPSMKALTFMPTVLIELAPAPARLTPAVPPPVTAAEPASTKAPMFCVEVAVRASAPPAVSVVLPR